MKIKKIFATFLLLFLSFTFVGCTQDKDEEAISVYLWSHNLYNNGYVQYIQEQLPDVKLEFIIGNNDLNYYNFLNENGKLPDIITTRRFSLHDATGVKDQLMDLSTTNICGQIYDSYIKDFTNADGSINWLPLCGEVDGIIANKLLFDQYGIAFPTDYDSFIAAIQAFNNLKDSDGKPIIRGFLGDFTYDYTCLAVLQGLSISQLKSTDGKTWRQNYGSSIEGNVGLDNKIWPGCFERMEQFIEDAGILESDIDQSFSKVTGAFQKQQAAMIRAGGVNAVNFDKDENIEAVFLPYFGPNDEKWLLTYPAFHVAVNKDVEENENRRANALRVLEVMLSAEGQKKLSNGSDVISYSKTANLNLDPVLNNLQPLIDSNRLFIRIASNDFFSISKDVVTKMIKKELNAQQAYEYFDSQLKTPKNNDQEIIFSLEQGYSNKFTEHGNESFSVMANTLRQAYGVDLLLAPATSFTGTVIAGDYTSKMVGYMIMPNALDAYRTTISGERLKRFINAFIEGRSAGYTPFNEGSLPTVSGMSIVVEKTANGYKLANVYVNGEEIKDDDTYSFIVLSVAANMGAYLADATLGFKKESVRVIKYWTQYITDGGTLALPEKYITIKEVASIDKE